MATSASWIEGDNSRLLDFYPGFSVVAPPPGSTAIRAWKGVITPFPAGTELGPVLEDLDRDSIVDLGVSGALLHDHNCQFVHTRPRHMGLLGRVDTNFTVVILEFAKGKHPRVFCIAPEISRTLYPDHPHLLGESAWFGRFVQALCLYRPDEVRPNSLVQLLDYTSIFLAKHLVWARTAELVVSRSDSAPRLICPPMGAPLPRSKPCWSAGISPADSSFVEANGIDRVFRAGADERLLTWRGTWLGSVAPHEPAILLATVPPHRQCPCGSGQTYGACCRSPHLKPVTLLLRSEA